MTIAAGSGLAHYSWALWLAAPVFGIVVVSVAVWWWSRPARPATTSQSIAGHHAYLDALVRRPRERVAPPIADTHADPAADVEVGPVQEPAVTVRS